LPSIDSPGFVCYIRPLMWLSRFLFAYVALVTYVCIRVRRLFSRFASKTAFTLLFILLVLAFPVAEILAHRSGSIWSRCFQTVGFLSLPYLLYLFLTVFSLDLLLLANRLLKFLSRDVIRGRGFRTIALALMLGLPLAVVIAGILNHNHIRVNSYRIEVQRRSSRLAHLRIVLAADFHLRDLTRKGFMAECVAKINSLRPDIVLIPGDVLEGDRRNERTEEFERQFRQIGSTYGSYAVFGNHESHGGYDKLNFFRNAHIRVLQDETVVIDDSFNLIGRRYSRSGDRKTLEVLLKGAKGNLPIVLMDHRPGDIERVSHSPVDIQLSAHTHNGQLFPFNFITRREYEVSWGYKKIGNTHLFVTCGIQTWGPPVRTAGHSEIMRIDVDFVAK
jgi:predicted MPP superfamily phosphohydrolase